MFWNVAYDDSVEWTFAADAIFKLTAYPDYAWPELLQYFIPVLDLPEATPGGVVSRTIDLASHHSLVVVRAAGAWSIS